MTAAALLSTLGCSLLQGCDAQPPSEGRAGTSAAASAPSSSSKPAASSGRVDVTASRKAFMAKLAMALEQAEKAPKKLIQCAESVQGVVHAYGLPYARHLAKGVAPPTDAAAMTAFRPPFAELLEGESGVTSDEVAHLRVLIEPELIVIVRYDKLVMPAVKDAESFLTGELEGWAYVVDLTKKKVVCSTPLEFTSSEKVEWTESLSPEQAAQRFDIDKSDAAFHVRVDFFIQGQRALKQALSKIGPKLELGLRGER